jgi:hypothetical protein
MTATAAEIAADLRALSPGECVDSKRRTERNPNGIRHSSQDDHSTAIFPGDNQHVTRMELCYSTNKALRRAAP